MSKDGDIRISIADQTCSIAHTTFGDTVNISAITLTGTKVDADYSVVGRSTLPPGCMQTIGQGCAGNQVGMEMALNGTAPDCVGCRRPGCGRGLIKQ